MPQFSRISTMRLATAHPDLARLFNVVIQKVDCSILCGHRGEQEQEDAYEEGNSKLRYPQSKHNSVPSHAVDVMPYANGIDWTDIQRVRDFAVIVKSTAAQLGIEITWGGDWAMRDYDHWQLKNP